ILPPPAEGSREVAARFARARAMQVERYAAVGLPQVRTNAAAQGPLLEEVARPDAGGLALLRDAADAMRLSARGYHRVLRAAGAPPRRSRRRRKSRPRAFRRGAVLPRARRRGAPRGVSARCRHSRRSATSSTRWLSTFLRMRSARWRVGKMFSRRLRRLMRV